MNDWARDRARFSHDWLKNTFMVNVLAQLNVCKGTVKRNHVDAMMFLVSTWRENAQTAQELLANCEHRMSPVTLLNEEPLVKLNANDIQQLSILVHAVWLRRYKIQDQIRDTIHSLEQATNAVKTLEDVLVDTHYYEPAFYEIIETIYQKCLSLSDAMSRLPKHVLV